MSDPCPLCGGSGAVPVGEHFISHEMAMDGSVPEMEGASMGIEWGPCPDCDGARRIQERAERGGQR